MFRTAFALSLLFIAASPLARAADSVPERSWTTQDSLAVRYIPTNLEWPGYLEDGVGKEAIEWSADRKHFFLMTRHGDLGCDCTVYRLHVYAADALLRILRTSRNEAAQPFRTVEFQSSRSDGTYQGITLPHWESGDSIMFLGVRGDEPRQIYRLELSSGVVTQLTRSQHDIWRYAVHGDAVVYAAINRVPNHDMDVYPAAVIDADEVLQLTGVGKGRLELFASRGGEAATRSIAALNHIVGGPWLAPGGRHALVALALEGARPPGSWDGYDVKSSKYFMSIGQFMLVDLASGAMQPVLDAPTGKAARVGWQSAPAVLWSSDGLRAILVNTALPIEGDKAERKSTPYIVELDIRSGHWSVIDELFHALPVTAEKAVTFVRSVDWLREGEVFRIRKSAWDEEGVRSLSKTTYTRGRKRWEAKTEPDVEDAPAGKVSVRADLQITVRQSANEPPMPVARYKGRELALLKPDPALAGIWRAPMRAVQWRERDGRVVEGGLMLPREATGRRPALVIQAYNYQPDLFRPDGPQPTAYTAQSLVSAGMAVLAVDIPLVDRQLRDRVTDTVHEGEAFVERIDAVVASLAADGLIDAERVGLIGFSRASFMTYYAITHPGNVKLQAAVLADGFTGSYGELVSDAATASDGRPNETFADYYSGTFWRNKAAWLKHAPGFNVDQSTTPALFMMHGSYSTLFTIETLGAFRINRRPFEYWSFSKGSHQLQRPKERLASLDGSVDWMTFWLLDKENGGMEKAQQYERWRKIKSNWEKVKSTEAPGGAMSAEQGR